MKQVPLTSWLINKPLRDVFWLYGVIPSQLLWAITLFVYFNGATLATDVLMFGLVLAYTAWIIAQIWLNTDTPQQAIYGTIARYLTAAWAVNSVLLVMFLLLQSLR